VKVRILKDIVSVHGTFRKGQVVNLPAGVAAVWLTKDGVIREETGPEAIGNPRGYVLVREARDPSQIRLFHREEMLEAY